jgi:hypothetical protein
MLNVLLGICIGMVIGVIYRVIRCTGGQMIIDKTDLIKDRYRININDLDKMEKKRYVILRVLK